jgi:hypothetical protein
MNPSIPDLKDAFDNARADLIGALSEQTRAFQAAISDTDVDPEIRLATANQIELLRHGEHVEAASVLYRALRERARTVGLSKH